MLKSLPQLLRRILSDRRGNIAVLTALAMPVLAGSVGLGAEVASWYGAKREMQNAADSAAIAAATNASDNFEQEGRAVAARYGYRDGQNNVTVTVEDGVPCPTGGADCYRATVSRVRPLLLAQLVGFQGRQSLDGAAATRISATAVAVQALAPREYCVLALAGSGAQGIRANGTPNAELSGCSVMSNTSARCTGHGLNADYGDAAQSSDGCGRRNNSNVPPISDPYAHLASAIPAQSCGTYYWAPDKKKDPALPSSNHLHGMMDFGVKHICGDAQANGPVLINQPNSILVIHGGRLDLQGYTLETRPGASLTIIFTGEHFSQHDHIPMGGGMLDIAAPTSGPWKGVAVYQDPALTQGVDITEAGNSPAWSITGLVYLPHADVAFSGVVNKASNGASCFALVTDTLLVNGTGQILAHGECPQAGLPLPESDVPSRGKLLS